METTARPQFVTARKSGANPRTTFLEALFARSLKGLKGGSLRISFPSGAQLVRGATS